LLQRCSVEILACQLPRIYAIVCVLSNMSNIKYLRLRWDK